MKLDIFILGVLSEKPINLKKLIKLAESIKISKWTDFTKESLLDRIEILEKLNFIKNEEFSIHSIEKGNLKTTEIGNKFFKEKIYEYLFNPEINLGLLLLFFTFSNHFDKNEILSIVEKRIEGLKLSKFNKDNSLKGEFLSPFEKQSVYASNLLCESELKSLEEFLIYSKNSTSWNNFLTD